MKRDELEEVLMSLAEVVDGDEPVDELTHALQCARLAQLARANQELVAAALFHDVARSPLVSCQYPDLPHELAAASWLRPRLGEQVAWLAGAHVAAKVHLLATEPGYLERLSPESLRSAARQQSALQPGFLEHRWWPDALALRRWDDAAKDPSRPLGDTEELLEAIGNLRR